MNETPAVHSIASLWARIISPIQETHVMPDGFPLHLGKLIGVNGESGVGKTQLIRALFDSCVARLNESGGDTDSVAFVTQDLGLLSELSIAQNVLSYSRRRKLTEVVALLPSKIGGVIQARRRCSPVTLSGGERRMLVLASTVVRRPELLLLDETLQFMDPARLRHSIQLVRDALISRSSLAVILISHDPRVLRECDVVYKVSREGTKCWLRQVPHSCDSPLGSVRSSASELTADAQHSVKGNRALARLAIGGFLAAVVMLGFIEAVLLFGANDLDKVMPGSRAIMSTFWSERSTILTEGSWSLASACIALVVSILICLLFWGTGMTSVRTRQFVASTWTAFQAIPVAILAPLLVLVIDLRGRGLEVVIAVFISIFPLGLLGARAVAKVPMDVFRAHGARGRFERYIVAVKYSIGDIGRAVVACSPLVVIGVLVAEFLQPEHGLGSLVQQSLTDIPMDRTFAYLFGCILLSLCMMAFATVWFVVLLPRDIEIE